MRSRPYKRSLLVSTIAFIAIGTLLLGILGTTQNVQAASNSHWALTSNGPLIVKKDGQSWLNIDFQVGQNGMYLLAWDYPSGSTVLLKSHDGGVTWVDQVTVFDSMWNANPKMCIYPEGMQDHILVVASDTIAGVTWNGVGYVKQSLDSGATFSDLADIPVSPSSMFWRSMCIETNMSMIGAFRDSDVYVAGYQYAQDQYGQDVFHLAFIKSLDGGETWLSPTYIENIQGTIPRLLSDGTNLYMIYLGAIEAPGPTYVFTGPTYIIKSSDWGATWSEPIALLYNSGFQNAVCNVQYIGEGRAFLTCVQTNVTSSQNFVHFGYLDLVNEDYQMIGLMKASSMVKRPIYFSGKLLENGSVAGMIINSDDGGMSWDIEYVEFSEVNSQNWIIIIAAVTVGAVALIGVILILTRKGGNNSL